MEIFQLNRSFLMMVLTSF